MGAWFFGGTKPIRTLIAMDAEASCVKAHVGHPVYDDL